MVSTSARNAGLRSVVRFPADFCTLILFRPRKIAVFPPTRPTLIFFCRPCSFYCHPYRPLKFSGKWTYDLKYVKTATIIFKITLFNLLYVSNFGVCHYLVFEMLSIFTCFQQIKIREKIKRFAYLPTLIIFGMLAETQLIFYALYYILYRGTHCFSYVRSARRFLSVHTIYVLSKWNIITSYS